MPKHMQFTWQPMRLMANSSATELDACLSHQIVVTPMWSLLHSCCQLNPIHVPIKIDQKMDCYGPTKAPTPIWPAVATNIFSTKRARKHHKAWIIHCQSIPHSTSIHSVQHASHYHHRMQNTTWKYNFIAGLPISFLITNWCRLTK